MVTGQVAWAVVVSAGQDVIVVELLGLWSNCRAIIEVHSPNATFNIRCPNNQDISRPSDGVAKPIADDGVGGVEGRRRGARRTVARENGDLSLGEGACSNGDQVSVNGDGRYVV